MWPAHRADPQAREGTHGDCQRAPGGQARARTLRKRSAAANSRRRCGKWSGRSAPCWTRPRAAQT